MSQTTYNTSMTIAREGALAHGWGTNAVVESKIAQAALKFGLLVQRHSCTQVKPLIALPAADTDAFAIAGAIASAAADQEILEAAFAGVIGDGLVPDYCGRLSFTLNNNAHWLATEMWVYGEGASGEQVTESIAIPANGNVVLYTRNVYRRISRLFIPAQGGVAGTMLVGIDYTMPYASVNPNNFPGIALLSHAKESFATLTEVAANQQVNVLTHGAIWVVTETAVSAGDLAYVRIVVDGTDLRGQFAGDRLDTHYCRLPGGKFLTPASADGLAVLQIGGDN